MWGAPNRRDLVVREGCEAERVQRKGLRIEVSAYLGLVAQAVAAIDPDVLCQTFASLVEFHVLGKLWSGWSVWCCHFGDGCQRMLTLDELDTMVDSPTPACRRESVRQCKCVGQDAGSP